MLRFTNSANSAWIQTLQLLFLFNCSNNLITASSGLNGPKTFCVSAFSITTLSIRILSIRTLRIMTLRKITFRITINNTRHSETTLTNDTQYDDTQYKKLHAELLCWVSKKALYTEYCFAECHCAECRCAECSMKKALLTSLNRIYYWWYFGWTLLITILN